jgi:hypothetical protein
MRRLYLTSWDIAALVPPKGSLILVDQGSLGSTATGVCPAVSWRRPQEVYRA